MEKNPTLADLQEIAHKLKDQQCQNEIMVQKNNDLENTIMLLRNQTNSHLKPQSALNIPTNAPASQLIISDLIDRLGFKFLADQEKENLQPQQTLDMIIGEILKRFQALISLEAFIKALVNGRNMGPEEVLREVQGLRGHY